MTLDLLELSKTDFRTTKEADDINTRFQNLLSLNHKYGPARLAIGLSLSQDGEPALTPNQLEEMGKSIRGEFLFGTATDIATWTALLVERLTAERPGKRELQLMVAAHWHRGIQLMWEAWKAKEQNFDQFLIHIMERAGLKTTGGTLRIGGEPGLIGDARPMPVELMIGDPSIDLATNQVITWKMNSRGISPHIAVMGTLGTGKTRLANGLMTQIKTQAPDCAFLVLDMGKGDLANDHILVQSLGAQVLNSPRSPIPLDVLYVPEKTENAYLEAAKRFRDSLARASTSRLGANQLDLVKDAALRALRRKSPTTIIDVKDALIELYDEQKRKSDAVVSTLKDLCDYQLFSPTMSPEDFLARSWVLDVHSCDEQTQKLVVYLVIDAVHTYLNRLKDSEMDADFNRAMRLMVVVDEARKVLGYGHVSLLEIVRTSRSKGGAVMFISQSPDDFAEDDNFMSDIGLTISFRTNAKPAGLKSVLGENVDLAGLPAGVCVTRLPEKKGVLRIKAW